VGSEMQGEGELHMAPQGPGHSSIGTRINQRDYFKGAVFEARFTRRALEPDEFLKMPAVSSRSGGEEIALAPSRLRRWTTARLEWSPGDFSSTGPPGRLIGLRR
jgi:hypothetical protein